MTPDRINIATALNSKYMRYTYVMLTSFFMNHPDLDVHVYLLHSDLTASDQSYLTNLGTQYHNTIHYLRIDNSMFPDSLPTTTEWPLEAYYRLLLLDILPQDIDRLLYLDVDMIIDKPITAMYQTAFEDHVFCVCRDMGVTFPFNDCRQTIFQPLIENGLIYFNSGLLLWNIPKLREKYNFQAYLDLADSLHYQVLAPDQDLLNYMHWNEVKFLDEYQFNLFSRLAYNNDIHYEDIKRETSIIHFAGMKPWEGQYVHYDIEKIWWDYAKETPFYHELLEEFVSDCINSPLLYDTMNKLSEEKRALTTELTKSTALCQKLLSLLENKPH